jgi:hypothetical protein
MADINVESSATTKVVLDLGRGVSVRGRIVGDSPEKNARSYRIVFIASGGPVIGPHTEDDGSYRWRLLPGEYEVACFPGEWSADAQWFPAERPRITVRKGDSQVLVPDITINSTDLQAAR